MNLLLCGVEICLFLFDRTARIDTKKVSTCRVSFGGSKPHVFNLTGQLVLIPPKFSTLAVTDPCMHNEIVPICEIKSCIPICKIIHTGIAVCIRGSPYAYGQGSLKYLHTGIPVCITKLCAYWEQHTHVLGSSSLSLFE
jgi:hypothetical protein